MPIPVPSPVPSGQQSLPNAASEGAEAAEGRQGQGEYLGLGEPPDAGVDSDLEELAVMFAEMRREAVPEAS